MAPGRVPFELLDQPRATPAHPESEISGTRFRCIRWVRSRSVPVFVVTHKRSDAWSRDNAPFTFVIDASRARWRGRSCRRRWHSRRQCDRPRPPARQREPPGRDRDPPWPCSSARGTRRQRDQTRSEGGSKMDRRQGVNSGPSLTQPNPTQQLAVSPSPLEPPAVRLVRGVPGRVDELRRHSAFVVTHGAWSLGRRMRPQIGRPVRHRTDRPATHSYRFAVGATGTTPL